MRVSPPAVRRRAEPAIAYLDMLFADYGMFRLLYVNRHRVGDRAWRSAQPAPHHIEQFARDGIRTIVNLRNDHIGSAFLLEKQACAKHGVTLVTFPMFSRDAPAKEQIFAARKLFETAEYPILMHCKSGADRAGLMAVLYRYIHEGVPLDVARKELSLRYGHVRQADTGILDYFFDRYLADNARKPMPFFEWVETVYDPVELKRTFRSRGWANRLVDSVLNRE